MSRGSVIQNGTQLRYEHFCPSTATSPLNVAPLSFNMDFARAIPTTATTPLSVVPLSVAPLSFNMDFARAILNFGSRGSLTDNTRGPKEPDSAHVATLDDFLIDDLAEFSNEEIAAPISDKDLIVNKFESCESSSTFCSNDFSFQGNGLETKSFEESNANGLKDIVGPLCNDITPALEWFSAFDDESYGIHEASKFEENAFLSSCNDQMFFPASGLNGSPLDKIHSDSFLSDKLGSRAIHHEKQLSAHFIDPKGLAPKEMPVPGRARSKRSRSDVWVWSSANLFNSTNTRNGSTGSTSEFSDPSVASLDSDDLYQDGGSDEDVEIGSSSKNEWKATRKSKKGQDTGQARRCAHCLSQKTPQWRAGPTGSKTLCNACGVRYKSGRLFPEYRPAKSPTFLSHRHSNSHKKVLEMRRDKLAPVVRFRDHQQFNHENLNAQLLCIENGAGE